MNHLCGDCKVNDAGAFCPCTSPVTFLCRTCVGSHITKDKQTHTVRTLDQLDRNENSQPPRRENPSPAQIPFKQVKPSPPPVREEVKQETLPTRGLGSGKFAAVYFNKVELYDLATQQSVRHNLAVDFGDGGSYIELDSNTLLCVGGFPAAARVVSLDLNSLQLTPLPSLRTPRCGAGVGKIAAWVYVFGGQGQASCEKYHLQDRQWQALASMHHPRSHFTPCVFGALIYLISTSEHRAIETFDPSSEVFTLLSVSLPQQLRLNSRSVAFVSSGEVCLLTNDMQKARWKIETEREFRLSTAGRNCSSTQLPRIVGQVVLIASSGRLEKFSLQSYSFV